MAYSVAVGQSWVSRSDFWKMPCAEFWWLVSAKMPDIEKQQPNNIAAIRDMVKKAKEADRDE